jgi:hypothetical protein
MGLSPDDLLRLARRRSSFARLKRAMGRPQAAAAGRDVRNRLRWQATVCELAESGADLRPVLAHAPTLSALSSAAAMLERRADQMESSEPSQAASLSYQASLFHGQAGHVENAAQLRERAFSLVSKAVASPSKASRITGAERLQLAAVTVSAPARIDFGGGGAIRRPCRTGAATCSTLLSPTANTRILRLLDSPVIRLRLKTPVSRSNRRLCDQLGWPAPASLRHLRPACSRSAGSPALLDRIGGCDFNVGRPPVGLGLGSRRSSGTRHRHVLLPNR